MALGYVRQTGKIFEIEGNFLLDALNLYCRTKYCWAPYILKRLDKIILQMLFLQRCDRVN